jgi:hypothetical protein
MMWTVPLDYGISLSTHHDVVIDFNGEAWGFSPDRLKFLLEQARVLLPWVIDFQVADWCWQGGETVEDIYEKASDVLNSNVFAPRLLSAFEECIAERRIRESHAHTSPKSTKVTDGYVYLLRGDNCYKIGLSNNVYRRWKEVSPKLPFETEIVTMIATEDMYKLEASLHKKFSGKRMNGEWFDLDNEDVEYIKKLAGEGNSS